MSLIITNIGQLVTPEGRRPKSGAELGKLSVREDICVKIEKGKITRIESMRALSPKTGTAVLDAEGGVVIPGLVDPHTHAVFYGSREEEFLRRCQGAKYGKGILTTVEAVRRASEDELYAYSKGFLLEMLRAGTTTVEIKSGYGLDTQSELKMLKVIRRLQQDLPLDLVPTFLGAHAVPQDKKKSEYIAEIIGQMIPQIKRAKLAEFCDVFCEAGFFNLEESREILTAAKGAGFSLKIHADEFSAMGGAELASELGAVSADHLLKISYKGIKCMKKADVIAVLLPGTAFSLNADYAPARIMLEAGLPIALGTDFNPGTCLIHSMLFIMALAVLKMQMSVEEALTASTLNAACAVKRADQLGSLELNKQGDLLILDLENYKQIPYFMGHNFIRAVVKRGKVVYKRRE